MRKVEDWLGRPIDLAESKSGVLAFVDPFGGLLRGDLTPWPPASVVQKLYSTRDFSGPDGTAVASSLGGYSDLQSVNSEDAITWSVFGPVAHSPPEVRKRFVAELFQAAEIQVTPGPATISLWRRIPHPETLGLGGPELDVMIQTPHAVVFVEAKWGSSVGTGQGRKGDKDQVQLRMEFFGKYGAGFFPGVECFVVFGASWREPVITAQHHAELPASVQLRELTWETLCGMETHPLRGELLPYYNWKALHASPP